MPDEPIWHDTVDQGTYDARVLRVSDYTGRLVATEVATGSVLLDEEVPLAYGAIFGPDVDDVATWQHKTIEAIDGNQ